MGAGKEYSPAENLAICKAWIQVSEDPIAGKDQKGEKFFAKVFSFYLVNMEKEKLPVNKGRTACGVKNRWSKLNHDINMFNGHYGTSTSTEKSGWETDDYVTAAMELYCTTSKDKKPFGNLNCWAYLQNFPKWSAVSGGNKKRSAEVASDLADAVSVLTKQASSDEDSTPKRPRGSDYAKSMLSVEEATIKTQKVQQEMVELTRMQNELMANTYDAFIMSTDKDDPKVQEFFRNERQAVLDRKLAVKKTVTATVTPLTVVIPVPELQVPEVAGRNLFDEPSDDEDEGNNESLVTQM